MKMIIEKLDGSTYVYRETEKQFKENEKARVKSGSKKILLSEFDNDCLLDSYDDNCYAVIPMRVSVRKELDE